MFILQCFAFQNFQGGGHAAFARVKLRWYDNTFKVSLYISLFSN